MSFLQMSFAGAVLVLVVIVIRTLFIHKLPKRTFMILWGLVLLRLMVPISIPSIFSAYSIINKSDAVSSTIANTPLVRFIPSVPEGQDIDMGMAAQPLENNATISMWAVIWGIGVILCIGFFMVAYLRSYLEFQTSLPVDDGFAQQWLKAHQRKRKIELRYSDRIQAPLTYGIFHPVILLPKKMDWEDREQLDYVLLHEYVHICRFDAVTKLVLALTACLHWFNPMVWIMYVLFNRDMELYCDECVVRKQGRDSRSSYAYVLISMAEKQSGLMPFCSSFSKNAVEERITAIMKIKKNSIIAMTAGLFIVAAVILVFVTSGVKNEGKTTPDPSSGQLENVISTTPQPVEDEPEIKEPETALPVEAPEETKMLTFMVEGLEEEVPVTFFSGDGYSIYIPVEGWKMYAPDAWNSTDNEQVQFWVAHFEGKTMDVVTEEMSADGYSITEENGETLAERKIQDDIVQNAMLWEYKGSSWAVFYCYPSFATEGFGSRLPVIARTFAVTEEISSESVEAQKVRKAAEEFSTAYFNGDVETIKGYLADTYADEVYVFSGDKEAVCDILVKDLGKIQEDEKAERTVVSVEHRADPQDDYLQYLTIELVKQGAEWKVEFYTIEM